MALDDLKAAVAAATTDLEAAQATYAQALPEGLEAAAGARHEAAGRLVQALDALAEAVARQAADDLMAIGAQLAAGSGHSYLRARFSALEAASNRAEALFVAARLLVGQ
jgi:hypothetical protein